MCTADGATTSFTKEQRDGVTECRAFRMVRTTVDVVPELFGTVEPFCMQTRCSALQHCNEITLLDFLIPEATFACKPDPLVSPVPVRFLYTLQWCALKRLRF